MNVIHHINMFKMDNVHHFAHIIYINKKMNYLFVKMDVKNIVIKYS